MTCFTNLTLVHFVWLVQHWGHKIYLCMHYFAIAVTLPYLRTQKRKRQKEKKP